MKRSLGIGVGFGLTSGVITTLGVIVGLNAGTGSRLAVIGGVITIAFADAFSDALGMHIAQESQKNISHKTAWWSAMVTFFTKLVVALTFLVPILSFTSLSAIAVSIVWGLFIISVFSYLIAKRRAVNPWSAILEHLAIAMLVIIVTQLVGMGVARVFG
ncbi:MAG: hypothetical protein ABIC95_04370 [archaeon]